MAIEKRENVLQNLSISATHGVDDKGEIYYTSLNTTLQTATCYVDTETNNIIKTDANPAYQQPDAVVQQYLGEQLASLVVGPIEAEKAKTKAAEDKAKADLEAANAAHTAALAAKDTEKAEALAAKEAELTAERAKVTAEQAKATAAQEQHVTALAAKEAEKTALQAKLTKAEQDLSELGGEPLALQRKAEREKAEIAAKLEAITKEAKAAAIDIDAVVAEAKK